MGVVQRAWSEDEQALLRKLWDEGLSARECAAVIGNGRSRQSIIARVHRTGLRLRGQQPITAASARKMAALSHRSRTRETIITPKPSPTPRPRTTWTATPPKPSAPVIKVDPTSAASLMAAAILDNARRAEKAREVYRGRTL